MLNITTVSVSTLCTHSLVWQTIDKLAIHRVCSCEPSATSAKVLLRSLLKNLVTGKKVILPKQTLCMYLYLHVHIGIGDAILLSSQK